jgi:hypothetical protein
MYSTPTPLYPLPLTPDLPTQPIPPPTSPWPNAQEQTGGPLGFFQGYGATILRDVPYTMMELGLYQLAKSYLQNEILSAAVPTPPPPASSLTARPETPVSKPQTRNSKLQTQIQNPDTIVPNPTSPTRNQGPLPQNPYPAQKPPTLERHYLPSPIPLSLSLIAPLSHSAAGRRVYRLCHQSFGYYQDPSHDRRSWVTLPTLYTLLLHSNA